MPTTKVWIAHNNVIRRRLGLPEGKIPANYSLSDPTQINVAPEGERPLYVSVVVYVSEGGRTAPHRVYCYCPICLKEMSLGRLNQHYPCK